MEADTQQQSTIERLELENQRLRDLVRYQRCELHVAGLISEDEYASLAQDHGAVARLESYDGMRKRLTELENLLVDRASQAAHPDIKVPAALICLPVIRACVVVMRCRKAAEALNLPSVEGMFTALVYALNFADQAEIEGHRIATIRKQILDLANYVQLVHRTSIVKGDRNA
jgi:hypothetical protein